MVLLRFLHNKDPQAERMLYLFVEEHFSENIDVRKPLGETEHQLQVQHVFDDS